MMNRLRYRVFLSYDVLDETADFILNIEAARTARQHVVSETLEVSPTLAVQRYTDPGMANRLLRMRANRGLVSVHYEAVVDVDPSLDDPLALREVPVAELPFEVLPYLAPSRYAESDRLRAAALREFGHLTPGYCRVMAIRSWVQNHVQYLSQSSVETTSATDTLVQRVGVCRDFANLMVGLCRALNLPARFASSLDYGKNPSLGPPDFHAVVEVFLSDRWYVFDPSGVSIPTGLIRIGTGRDASDIPFAALFGAVLPSAPPVIEVMAVTEDGHPMPTFTTKAISTW